VLVFAKRVKKVCGDNEKTENGELYAKLSRFSKYPRVSISNSLKEYLHLLSSSRSVSWYSVVAKGNLP
jgi:flagellum-specific peptidoglycan hydrolase FlgJ